MSAFKKLLKKIFRKKPQIEVVDYAKETVHFRCLNVALEPGTTVEASTKLPGGEEIDSVIHVLACDDMDYIYTGKVKEPAELTIKLTALFPPAIDEEKPWEEKRAVPRVNKVLGVTSPQIPGFKSVTYDITTVGCRLEVDEKIPPGTHLDLTIEFDDHRLEPIQVSGTTLWCRMKPYSKQEWVGVKFDPLSEEAYNRLNDFLEKVRKMDRGVISREYRFD